MNYHDYRPHDLINGDGLRSTLFVSGCSHGCKGCYNAETWSPGSGNEYTKALEDKIISDLKGEDGVTRQGLTLTGGDPLHENNREDILILILRVRDECPDKDIWLWTGYTKDEVYESEDSRMKLIVESVDYLIDGKFDKEKHDPRLKYRGSSNQNVYKHLERIL